MGRNLNTFKTLNIHEKTPDEFYKQLDDEFHFDFDPCPLHSTFDGLSISWNYKTIYVHPPYGKPIRSWLEKGLNEMFANHCQTLVYLLPSRTGVKWFHDIVLQSAKEIRFIKGRLKFGEHNNPAPFDSMIVVFGKNE